ncbi:alcohol dehydrogenase [Sulfodiicoccus acidiphilus]|uniref:Alcohol dehydrogenase n=1 Tax=Sulfodiicoccus acidiphilus TaxID=1670455 RepID=A0A348B683_9CREN|nr:alcohol dehydrogenase catalytic domain-containing protein [Sulfodiicoccus acidiphilus]BBD73685.1 alcohol dehydrogenase [Sulfodiicoccus acidiphilus]GGT97665.1 alcohol dehydrogenase [Sulfodiicoccus acidiphilus]
MKALQFDSPGLDKLRVVDLPKPKPEAHEVLLRVEMAGVNPVDYSVVTGNFAKPMPHVPGAEVAGTVEEVGQHVRSLKPGDKVVLYNRVFDGNCDMCASGMEMECRNGGIMSIVTNGGFAEYMVAPEWNLIKVPEVGWDVAASLPVAALTSYHALKVTGVSPGKAVAVIGASGNTGIFAVQLAKLMGATVVALSSKSWLKEFGADYVSNYSGAKGQVEKATDGLGVDVVVATLGAAHVNEAMSWLKAGGKVVTFGAIGGDELKLSLSALYGRHLSLVGTTGGTRAELMELARLSPRLKVKTWKIYPLAEGATALSALRSSERDGRIFIEP